MTSVFAAAMREWRRSSSRGLAQGDHVRANLRQRLDQVMALTLNREIERLERHMPFASVGSVAPFIGLFGTVWGIMNSFQSIAATKNTSLAVVAPGIAGALFATALGLIAAIPAVIAYNKLSTILAVTPIVWRISRPNDAILSRQMDEGVTDGDAPAEWRPRRSAAVPAPA